MTFGSLYTGIGGADLGLQQAGFCHVWQAERDAYRQAVLRRRFPGGLVYGDVADVTTGVPEVDLLYAELPVDAEPAVQEVLRVAGALTPAAVVVEARPDYALAAATALSALGYGGVLARLTYDLTHGALFYSRVRGFAVAVRADGFVSPKWTETSVEFAVPPFDAPPGALRVAEFFEALVGLPLGWGCVCGCPDACAEAAARAAAANDATRPGVAEFVGRAVLRLLETRETGRVAVLT